MAKLYTGGFEVVGLGGSWHGVTGTAGVGVVRQRSQGIRSRHARDVRDSRAECLSLPGQALPRPLRPHLHEDRLRDVRHAVDGRAGGRHRRAGDQRRRCARSARRLLRCAAGGSQEARHAADLRRSADGVRPPWPLVRGDASAGDARHHDRVENAGGWHAAGRRDHERRSRGRLPSARLRVLHVARVRSAAVGGRSRRAGDDRKRTPSATQPRHG